MRRLARPERDDEIVVGPENAVVRSVRTASRSDL